MPRSHIDESTLFLGEVLVPPFAIILIGSLVSTVIGAITNYYSASTAAIQALTSNLEEATSFPAPITVLRVKKSGQAESPVDQGASFSPISPYPTTPLLASIPRNATVPVSSSPTDNNVTFEVSSDAVANRAHETKKLAAKTAFFINKKQAIYDIILVPSSMYVGAAAVKSLMVMIMVFYRYDLQGGWWRFCVVGSANFASGQLTPIVEHILKWILPTKVDKVKKDLPDDEAWYLSLDFLFGKSFDVEGLVTVIVQGCLFVLVGCVFIPTFASLGLVGLCAFPWVLLCGAAPCMILRSIIHARQCQPVASVNPKVEFAVIVVLKSLAMGCVTWIIQSGVFLGACLLNDACDGYLGAARTELTLQLDHASYFHNVMSDRFFLAMFVTQLIL